LITLVNQNNF